MLMITPVPGSQNMPCFRLGGRLVSPWIDAVSGLQASQAEVRLDLSVVQFIDSEGLTLLHGLQQQRAVLEHVTPYYCRAATNEATMITALTSTETGKRNVIPRGSQ